MESDDPTSTHTDRSTDERATRTPDPPRTGPAALPERYASLTLSDGNSLIYDQRDPNVWIQSDVVRSLDRMM